MYRIRFVGRLRCGLGCDVFRKVDINGDGMMEWDEFTRFVVVKAQLHHAQMSIDQLAEYHQGSRQVRKIVAKNDANIHDPRCQVQDRLHAVTARKTGRAEATHHLLVNDHFFQIQFQSGFLPRPCTRTCSCLQPQLWMLLAPCVRHVTYADGGGELQPQL